MRTLMRSYLDATPTGGGGAAAVVEPPVGAAPVNLAPASASAPLDLSQQPPAPAAFVLPDGYKDKPYLKGVDSLDKVFKMLDGAQALIGQKGPAVPKDDAPKEEWDAYYEAQGRPKAPTDYKLEGFEKADPKFGPKVLGALHEAGLSSKQAGTVWTKVNAALAEYMTEKGIADEQQNTDFTKLATETFGAQRDQILASSKKLLDENVSPAMKQHVAKLSNENLIVLADVLNNLNKRYIKQDGPGGPPTMQGGTPDQLREKARALMAQQNAVDAKGHRLYDPLSPQYQSLQKEIDGLYDQIRRGQR